MSVPTTGYQINSVDISNLIQSGGGTAMTNHKNNGTGINYVSISANNVTQQVVLYQKIGMPNSILASGITATSSQGAFVYIGNNALNANAIYQPGTAYGTNACTTLVGTIPTWCNKIGVIVITPGCGGGGGQSASGTQEGAGGSGAAGGTFVYTQIPITSDRNFYAYIPGGGAGGGAATTSTGTASKGAYPGYAGLGDNTTPSGSNSPNDTTSTTLFKANGITYKHTGGNPGSEGYRYSTYGSGAGGTTTGTLYGNNNAGSATIPTQYTGNPGIIAPNSKNVAGGGYYDNNTPSNTYCVPGGAPNTTIISTLDSSVTWTNYGRGGSGGAADFVGSNAYAGSGGGGGIIKVYFIRDTVV